LALRAARWYGSRCLGLAAGLFCSLAVWSLPEFWQALAAIGIIGGTVAVAAWGSFRAGGAYANQPPLAKVALAATFLLGLSALGFFGKSYLGRWWEETGARELYLLDRQGRVLDVHQHHNEFRVATLEGEFHPDLQGARLDYHALLENASPEAQVVDLVKRRSYRSWNRLLLEHKNSSRPGNENWWFVPDQGLLVGYDVQSHRLIGRFGPDGYTPPDRQPNQRFQGPLYHLSNFPKASAFDYLAFPTCVYRVDFHKRTIQPYFVPPPGETVLWASRWEDEKKSLALAFVGTSQSFHVVNEAGEQVISAPLAFDPGNYRIRGIGRLEEPERYWVWFEPQWFLDLETLERMSAYLVEYDAAGREIARRAVPARPEDARRHDPRMLAFEPSSNLALSGLVTSPVEFVALTETKRNLSADVRGNGGMEMSLLLPVLFYPTQFYLPSVGYLPRTPAGLTLGFSILMGVSAVLCALICFLLARRSAFSRSRCIGWTVVGLSFGLSGLLLMLASQEWPAQVTCPKCGKLRVVMHDLCEHCGALHALPAADGTEIFEETKDAPRPALASR
jgi:hypothetical protein